MICLGYCAGSSWFAVMAELELKNDSDTPEAKKPLISPKIGTHNGTFHCDEALACFMLKQLPEYRLADIVRTRNPEELAKCDIVVDVGGVYDADKHRYDHHQRYVDMKLSIIEEIERLKKNSPSRAFVWLFELLYSTQNESPVIRVKLSSAGYPPPLPPCTECLSLDQVMVSFSVFIPTFLFLSGASQGA